MHRILLTIAFIGAICIKVSGSAVNAVPTAAQWFQTSYWSDNLCSAYAGEYTVGLYECYHTMNDYARLFVNTTSTPGVYALSSRFYMLENCIGYIGKNTTEYYNSGCTDTGLGYYYSSAVINAPRTSFPIHGVLSKFFDNDADCANGTIGMMAYQYQVFGTGICFPWVNGEYRTVESCSSSYSSFSNSTCRTDGNFSSNVAVTCFYDTSGTTKGGLTGYFESQCYVDPTSSPTHAPNSTPSPSVVPTVSSQPSFMPSVDDYTYFFQYKFWSDSACTQYAGEQGSLFNQCIFDQSGGHFINSTAALVNGEYIVTTKVYQYGTCLGDPLYTYTDTFGGNCTYNPKYNGYYYTIQLINGVPSSFEGDGALTRLYVTTYQCQYDLNQGIDWYEYQVFGSSNCFPFINGEISRTSECGVYGNCYNDDTYTITTNQCGTTLSYATDNGVYGYANTVCFTTDSGKDDKTLSPAILAAIIVPSVVVALVAAAALYYYFVMVPASALTSPLLAGADVKATA